MENTKPLVSVLLGVYNGETYLSQAIQSVLDQTYKNFELVVLSDAHTSEESLRIINQFSDLRIRHIRLPASVNTLASSLNVGIDESKGKYIARMDVDDISLPKRLEREVAYMEKNLGISICGAWAKTFGLTESVIKHPTHPEEIKANLLFQASLVHPTVIMRKETLDKYNLRYNPAMKYCEDLDMWLRASRYVKIANIAEVLLLYRSHATQGHRQAEETQRGIKTGLRETQLSFLGIRPSLREMEIHSKLSAYQSEKTEAFQIEASEWLQKIAEVNSVAHEYDPSALKTVLGKKWFAVCFISAKKLGLAGWKIFWASPLSRYFEKDAGNILRLTRFFFLSLRVG